MSFLSFVSHLFTPKISNKHKAKLIHWEIILATVVVLVFGNKYFFNKKPQVLGFASQISTKEVIRLTNVKRGESNLSAVTENTLLDAAAKQKGLDMLSKGYWAHVAPDGTQPWDFFKKVNYKYKYAGENLARDFSSASTAVDAWMASPSHRENMLNPKYKDIGVAVVDGSLAGQDATIIVQLFGTLAADRPQVPVASAKEETAIKTEPEPIPVPEVASVATTNVLETPKPVEIIPLSKVFSAAIISVLILVMLVDTVIIWKRGVNRKSSRSVAQIAFLFMILAIIVVVKVGQII